MRTPPARPRLAAAALLAAACGRPPERLADCEDAPCREAWLASHLETDAASAVEAVVALEDPLARGPLVGVVLARSPEQAPALCGRLASGPDGQLACDVADRPHIWAEVPEPRAAPRRAGPGPASTNQVPSHPFAAVPTGQAPAGGDPCADRPERTTCLVTEARLAASRRELRRAEGLCLAVEEGRWRDECFFQAAEGAMDGRSVREYGEALRLCGSAGRFSAQCHGHVAMRPALRAPRADLPGPGAWKAQVEAARDLAGLWAARDPAYGALQVDLFWAHALDVAYGSATRVTGDPLAVLPDAVAPHVRAAAAARLLALEADAPRDLDGWVAALATALERKGEAPADPPASTPHEVGSDLWQSDGPGEATIPAVYYRGVSRRAVAGDPIADLAICVLEAVARRPPADVALVAQGGRHADPVVRWTSERLLSALGPEGRPGPAPGTGGPRRETPGARPSGSGDPTPGERGPPGSRR